jgi:hypothetical protein
VAGKLDEERAGPAVAHEGPGEAGEGGFEGGPEGQLSGGGIVGELAEAEGGSDEGFVAFAAEGDV